ncbi:hypothetical protein EG329_010618 [Mollisiaceae sp. DMI_Dod_QoI]|nr:hypothetical protein EG329_010618 [Helotiales sp. DMI_Dod_QoI]
MIPIAFNNSYTEYELPEKAFQEGLQALNGILSLFESLVNYAILDILDSAPQENLEVRKQFPRLVALQNVENILDTPLQSTTGPVSFGTSRAQYQVANFVAHSFYETMSKIFSEVDRESNVQMCQPVQQDVEIDMTTLYQAQQFSEASEHLSRLLQDKVCRTSSNIHKAHMRLSGFENPEFDMMLSLCEGTDLWQQVYFSKRRLTDTETQDGIQELCAELKRSYRSRKVPRILFSGEEICKGPSIQSRVRTSAKPSVTTMRQILKKEESLRRAKGLHHREIKKNEKQRLGLLIATSLLHLYGSPLLQNVLNADTIYVAQDKSGDTHKGTVTEAYITCALSSEPIEQRGLIEDEPVPGDPFVLALTTVLLELELEEEVIIKDEDIDEFSERRSLYIALTRLHGDSEGNIDGQYYHIIDSCLQLYDQFSDTESKEYSRKIRTELFKKVIYPLKKRYEVLSNPGELVSSNAVVSQETASSSNSGFPSPQMLSFRAPRGPMSTIAEVSEVHSIIQNAGTPSNPLAVSSDPLLLASQGTISNSKHWLERIDKINKYLNNFQRSRPTARRVKIAILDTGCDLDASCLINLGCTEARLIDHWHDWSGTSKVAIDEDPGKHGTALVALLLRVALHAEVFVGRVAKDEGELGHATEKISQAIRYATSAETGWDVDIVTMSFGFPNVVTQIRDAMDDAIMGKRKRNKEIVFFAAANNDGSNSEELFPASHETVISVRGTDHTGGFVKKYNPEPWPQNKGPLYGTLAENVPYDLGNPASKRSGCSIATPVLAGIMAMIIQYVNYAANGDARLCARLQTRGGVLRVLHYIANSGPEGRRYVAPWKFFERNEEDRLALIKHALAELQSQV